MTLITGTWHERRHLTLIAGSWYSSLNMTLTTAIGTWRWSHTSGTDRRYMTHWYLTHYETDLWYLTCSSTPDIDHLTWHWFLSMQVPGRDASMAMITEQDTDWPLLLTLITNPDTDHCHMTMISGLGIKKPVWKNLVLSLSVSVSVSIPPPLFLFLPER